VTSFAFDVSDDRKLVGHADDVFVGLVLRRAGEEGLPTSDLGMEMAQTQFAVEVLENIKGELSGAVTVNQLGGYEVYPANRDYPEHGVEKGELVREIILVDDNPLLEPGSQYLFVTNPNLGKEWHQIVAQGFGNLPIEDEHHRRALVQRFAEATENQIDPFNYAERLDAFDVVLLSVGEDKTRVLREIRVATGLGLREAKVLADEVPNVVKEGVPREEAEVLEAKLRAMGAGVEVR
jgi:ribosomal protein L7/L12